MPRRVRDFLIDLTLVVAVLMAGGAMVLALHGRSRASTVDAAGPPTRRIEDAERYFRSPYRIGDPFARFRVAIWTDYQCPQCKTFELELRKVEQQLGDSLVVYYHHFPNTRTHPQALSAALIAECARAQGHFAVVHDALFQSTLQNLDGRLPAVDERRLRECFRSEGARRAIQDDLATSVAANVQGTPSLLIGDSLFLGGMSAEALTARLRSAAQR